MPANIILMLLLIKGIHLQSVLQICFNYLCDSCKLDKRWLSVWKCMYSWYFHTQVLLYNGSPSVTTKHLKAFTIWLILSGAYLAKLNPRLVVGVFHGSEWGEFYCDWVVGWRLWKNKGREKCNPLTRGWRRVVKRATPARQLARLWLDAQVVFARPFRRDRDLRARFREQTATKLQWFTENTRSRERLKIIVAAN